LVKEYIIEIFAKFKEVKGQKKELGVSLRFQDWGGEKNTQQDPKTG
jgi:hypothetical protein